MFCASVSPPSWQLHRKWHRTASYTNDAWATESGMERRWTYVVLKEFRIVVGLFGSQLGVRVVRPSVKA